MMPMVPVGLVIPSTYISLRCTQKSEDDARARSGVSGRSFTVPQLKMGSCASANLWEVCPSTLMLEKFDRLNGYAPLRQFFWSLLILIEVPSVAELGDLFLTTFGAN